MKIMPVFQPGPDIITPALIPESITSGNRNRNGNGNRYNQNNEKDNLEREFNCLRCNILSEEINKRICIKFKPQIQIVEVRMFPENMILKEFDRLRNKNTVSVEQEQEEMENNMKKCKKWLKKNGIRVECNCANEERKDKRNEKIVSASLLICVGVGTGLIFISNTFQNKD